MSARSRAGASLPALSEPRKRSGAPLLLCERFLVLARQAALQLAGVERCRHRLVSWRAALAAAAAAAAAAVSATRLGEDGACRVGSLALTPALALRKVSVVTLAVHATTEHVPGACTFPNRRRHKAERPELAHGSLRLLAPVTLGRRGATSQRVRLVDAAVLCPHGRVSLASVPGWRHAVHTSPAVSLAPRSDRGASRSVTGTKLPMRGECAGV